MGGGGVRPVLEETQIKAAIFGGKLLKPVARGLLGQQSACFLVRASVISCFSCSVSFRVSDSFRPSVSVSYSASVSFCISVSYSVSDSYSVIVS